MFTRRWAVLLCRPLSVKQAQDNFTKKLYRYAVQEWHMGTTCPEAAPPLQLFNVASGARITTVEELRPLCEQAQCAIKNTNVTDLSVRKTLRAEPSTVRVEWADGLQAVLAQLEAECMLTGPATAELQNVLLYSPGDFFKQHMDSRKGDKHIITLVVDTGLCPEPCKGGKLQLASRRPGQNSGAMWAASGAGSYCAWHTSVSHGVRPVHEGHRCVAVYNVYAEAASRLHPANLDTLKAAFDALLAANAATKEFISQDEEITTIGMYLFEDYRRCYNYVEMRHLYGVDIALLHLMVDRYGVPLEAMEVFSVAKLRGNDKYSDDEECGASKWTPPFFINKLDRTGTTVISDDAVFMDREEIVEIYGYAHEPRVSVKYDAGYITLPRHYFSQVLGLLPSPHNRKKKLKFKKRW